MDNRTRQTRSTGLIAALKRIVTPNRPYQQRIASALHPSYYQGTADEAKVARRRAKNKVAKRSRKINRGR